MHLGIPCEERIELTRAHTSSAEEVTVRTRVAGTWSFLILRLFIYLGYGNVRLVDSFILLAC
jgi:hypothetical protein